eukprot:CAMPEP_0203672816 /NCGR_PEP_ID=MMETSP0090-20130426/9563_1 /ASSEMBLY_ACC=CAM_ASM_001088 /TAXON_ID=426623 /ORGANISM="Chaetoceros affinis, Strain CCMP159" /LENGTH=441 /DNA_ID=CAMNT_0050538239 /DNA_START=125 /DNA_END=1450 /DNA_ORIENTATION=+
MRRQQRTLQKGGRLRLQALSTIISISYSAKRCNGFAFVPLSPSSSSLSFTTTSDVTSHDASTGAGGRNSIIPLPCSSTSTSTKLYLKAPPGSGYFTEEDQESFFPPTYDPMMEYPGTMRPGRTPENQPYSSLPIQESDPDPVPWPHFQEIEWHHNWGSPHEHPIPMEEFIDLHGRWATAEMEAEMRAGARRGVRERREMEEAQKAASFILDDDDDEEDEAVGGAGAAVGVAGSTSLDLGEGVDALIGAGAVAAAALSASSSSIIDVDESGPAVASGDDGDDDDDDDDDGDSFLLDLGLDEVGDDDDDDDLEDDDEDDDGDNGEEPAFATSDDGAEGILEALQSIIDTEDSSSGGGGVAAETDSNNDEIEIDFDDLGLDFDDDDDGDDVGDDIEEEEDDDDYVVMDDEDISMDSEDLTLDEMIGNEDMGADDEFDDGGFDYD